tara:strand:+ start:2258 stop:2776 length:519 start_codon:yes stop_codon:yes gene_type:complete
VKSENNMSRNVEAINRILTHTVGAYKVTPDAVMPTYGTTQSACFDIYACIASRDEDRWLGSVDVEPGGIVKVPTGLIFDIPEGYSIRLHPRSGLSLKKGLILANCEGVIDSDYVEETFVLIRNVSNETQYIEHGDRVCQGELVKNENVEFVEIEERPSLKTNRDGGFGSTGV